MPVIKKVEHNQIYAQDTQLANLLITRVLDFDLQTYFALITIHKTIMYLTAEQRDHLVYELQVLDLDQPTNDRNQTMIYPKNESINKFIEVIGNDDVIVYLEKDCIESIAAQQHTNKPTTRVVMKSQERHLIDLPLEYFVNKYMR